MKWENILILLFFKDRANEEEFLLKSNIFKSFQIENVENLQGIENTYNDNDDWSIWTHSENFFEINLSNNNINKVNSKKLLKVINLFTF